jgi:hypothetical protein
VLPVCHRWSDEVFPVKLLYIGVEDPELKISSAYPATLFPSQIKLVFVPPENVSGVIVNIPHRGIFILSSAIPHSVSNRNPL